MLRENITTGHWRHLASQLVACNPWTHTSTFIQRDYLPKLLLSSWKKCENHRRVLYSAASQITNSTNLSSFKVLELFAPLNSVLSRSAVTINTSMYFVISEPFVLPQGVMPYEVTRQQFCVLLSFVLNTKILTEVTWKTDGLSQGKVNRASDTTLQAWLHYSRWKKFFSFI